MVINSNYIRIVVLVITISFISTLNYAQVNDFKNYSYKPDKEYITSYWTVTKNIVTGPARWNKKEWIITGSIIAGGALLYAYDDEIRDAFQRNKSTGVTRNISLPSH